jgi:hypothetical protein
MRSFAATIALASALLSIKASADKPPGERAAPHEPSPTNEADELREAIARQGAQIEALRAELDASRGAREHPLLHLSGFVQIDWIVHNQSSQDEVNDANGTLLNQDRFTLRRGHLRAEAEEGPFSAALELDANTTNGPQVRPINAEVSAHWAGGSDKTLPALIATAGLMRIPFGFEVQELDWSRPFLERAAVLRALFPGEFDLGVRLRAKYRFLDCAIAAMNGNPIGAMTFPALDPVHEKDLVGRIGVDVNIASGVTLEAGVSADSGRGFHAGTPTTKDVVVWQDANGDGVVQPNEVTVIPGSAATPSRTFHRFAIGGDLRVVLEMPVLGVLMVRGEIVSASNLDRGLEPADPVGAGHDLREVGWAVGATQELTRWGAIGARYDRYNPDADASTQWGVARVPIDRTYGTLALAGMLKSGAQRLLAEYDINTNPLGITSSGAPATLAANSFALRAQLVF